MAAPMANVFVGTETGLLKGINVSRSEWSNLNNTEEIDKTKEIVSLEWIDSKEEEICVGLKNKTVVTFNTTKQTWSEPVCLDAGEGKLRGVCVYENKQVTCVDSGVIRLWQNERLDSEINAGKGLFVFKQNEMEKNVFATGGKENELKIWDINVTDKPRFTAKNVRHDWLELRVPVWVTCARFVPETQHVITCTGHHQVRMYDMKAQRRPVVDMTFDDHPITASSLLPSNSNQIVVGNSVGKMAILDIRKKQVLRIYKGFAGGIRDIACHKSQPVVASCGLDRFLRIHDLDSKHLICKFYLKSRLNCLLMTSDWKQDAENDAQEVAIKTEIESDVEIEPESDELWEQMPVVRTKTKKKNSANRLKHKNDKSDDPDDQTNGKLKHKKKKM